ncbi:MAG: UTP--glucose-1-phosphate uridylyltransferase [Polyangiaceae bacterium]|nr:UTP--glucose-1-phosphate uridylyltransferase [Polyangiaceae bacterium]
MSTLAEELDGLPTHLKERLAQRGFSGEALIARAGLIGKDREMRNRLPGTVEPPLAEDVVNAPESKSEEGNRLEKLGWEALSRGELALCVLAGGMATRMGGVVKALVEALPGKTFLDLRMAEVAHISERSGHTMPFWMMTSEATHQGIAKTLGNALDGEQVALFEQHVSLRLSPDGMLFRGADGEPDVYATGHGDLPDALRASGLLSRFVARGGKYVWIANLDNLGASVDPTLLGWFVERGCPLMVEVVDKVAGDKGGGPVRYQGRRLIVEEFRLPLDFDPKTVPVFNTNTFLVRADVLLNLALNWTYVEVEKKSDGKTAIQFERLLGEMTAAIEPEFVRVPREGALSRFLPVKDVPELTKRQPEIALALKARGILASG